MPISKCTQIPRYDDTIYKEKWGIKELVINFVGELEW